MKAKQTNQVSSILDLAKDRIYEPWDGLEEITQNVAQRDKSWNTWKKISDREHRMKRFNRDLIRFSEKKKIKEKMFKEIGAKSFF